MDQIELERLEEMEDRLLNLMGINTRIAAGQPTAELLDEIADALVIQQEMLAWLIGMEKARLRGVDGTGPKVG